MRVRSTLPIFIRVNRRLDRIGRDMENARESRDLIEHCTDPRMLSRLDDSIGRSMHNIYCGIEGILRDFALELDGSVPASPSFHADLLEQMSTSLDSRPALMQYSDEVKTLMRYRHAFRNGYGEAMHEDWLLEMLASVENRILPGLEAGLEVMRKFLEGEPEEPGFSDPSH